MEAGKPMKQNMAIAYNMKRKKKMANGGSVSSKAKDDVPEPNKKNAEDFERGLNRSDTDSREWVRNFKQGLNMAEGGSVGGAKTSTTGNKTKTGGSNPGGASTGGAGTVTITTGKIPPRGINISNVGGKTAARNAGGMDPSDEEDDMMMAYGGRINDNHQSPNNPHKKDGMDIEADEMHSGYVSHEGDVMRPNMMAIEEDDRRLGMHGELEQGPEGMMMAYGGELHGVEEGHQDELHEMDMVGRIMKQRQMHYSEGGKVANESGISRLSQMADDERNSFDDLVLRDDLESGYTGANSGDELGDAREDHDRADIVARIMSSRRKKDRMPRPA